MSTLAMTLPRLRFPSAKTVAVCLLQALGLAVALYVAALACSILGDVSAEYGATEDIQAVFRWLWVVPIPFYALAIGGKLAANALGKPDLVNSLWLRLPGRIAFSAPIAVSLVWAVVGGILTIAETQDASTGVVFAMSILNTISSTAVVYLLYTLKLRRFKDKPVADALFVSLFPLLSVVASLLVTLAATIAIIPLVIAFVGGTMKRSK